MVAAASGVRRKMQKQAPKRKEEKTTSV